MPTVLTENGYRFHFYSNEGTEPCHIHVQGKGGVMKVWLPSMIASEVRRYSPREQREIRDIIRTNKTKLMGAWDDFFGKAKS